MIDRKFFQRIKIYLKKENLSLRCYYLQTDKFIHKNCITQ